MRFVCHSFSFIHTILSHPYQPMLWLQLLLGPGTVEELLETAPLVALPLSKFLVSDTDGCFLTPISILINDGYRGTLHGEPTTSFHQWTNILSFWTRWNGFYMLIIMLQSANIIYFSYNITTILKHVGEIHIIIWLIHFLFLNQKNLHTVDDERLPPYQLTQLGNIITAQ